MLSIFLSIFIGLAIGYFATQNTAPVSLQFGDFLFDNVPLYMVAVGSFLAGLLIAWIFSLSRTVSASFTRVGSTRQENRVDRNVAALERRVHDLEVSNAQPRIEHPADAKTRIAA